MNEDLEMKQGDRLPSARFYLDGPAGVDLSGASSAQLNMRLRDGTGGLITGACTIESAGASRLIVRYDWAANDTAVSGDYDIEIAVTVGGLELTWPNNDPDAANRPYFSLKVWPELDAGTGTATPLSDYIHGPRTEYLWAADAVVAAANQASGVGFDLASTNYYEAPAVANYPQLRLPIPQGKRLLRVSWYGKANGTQAWAGSLKAVSMVTGLATLVGAEPSVTSGTAAVNEKKTSATLNYTIPADTYVGVYWWGSEPGDGGGVGNRWYGIEYVYDKVAP